MPSSHKNRLRMVDVADHAGCSQSAVSHVLTGSGKGRIRVSEKTAGKIRQAAKELDFQPSYAARMLRGKHTRVLGMISSYWRDHTQLRVFSWMQQITAAKGYQVLTAQAGTTEELKKTIREFHARGITEVLCFAGRGALRELEAFEALGSIPSVVSLFGSVPIKHSVNVNVDWAEGSRQAVRHLHNCGRKRIGMIVEELDSPISRARCDGFLDAHNELGLALHESQIIGEAEDLLWDSIDVDYRLNAILDRMLARGVDSIIANNDPLAALFIQRFAAHNLRVPEDVAVVGFENDIIAVHTTPALTTIRIPVREVVEHAVEMIVKSVEQPDCKAMQSRVFQPQLMVRKSG